MKIVAAVLAICATFAVTVSAASAHNATYTTRTHMFYSPPTSQYPTYDLIGSIRSRLQACEVRRTVVLLRNGSVVGRTTSFRFRDFGLFGWTSDTAFPSGTYRARVQRKILRRPGHRHVCSGAISNAVQLP